MKTWTANGKATLRRARGRKASLLKVKCLRGTKTGSIPGRLSKLVQLGSVNQMVKALSLGQAATSTLAHSKKARWMVQAH